jgi:adenosylcobinamide-phosphate synthase
LFSLDHLWLLALALAVDAVIGDPAVVWKRVPHPVAAIGMVIGALDRTLNDPTASRERRRTAGAVATILVVAVAAAAGYLLEAVFAAIPWGWIGTVIAAAVMLAGRSLYDHVAAVAAALRNGARGEARAAVARIVGRDVDHLDERGISRAAIESLAENFSDGVIAPALWFLILGLPGLAAYKAINTADSMIGHLTERHADFGWAAARLDDFANLPGSRFAGALIAAAAPVGGGNPRTAFRAMIADASKHASPNAGWPEAAMAGALGVSLGGARAYDGTVVRGAVLNRAGRADAAESDIRRALRIYVATSAIFAAVVAVAGLAVLVR